MHAVMPIVDLKDPRQNEFVQDWLCRFNEEYPTDQGDYAKVEAVVEMVQEIYTGPIPPDSLQPPRGDVLLDQLGKFIEVLRTVHTPKDIMDAVELTYAFVNAASQFAQES